MGGKVMPQNLNFSILKENILKCVFQNSLLNFKMGGRHPLLKIDRWISIRATHSN